MTKIYFVIDDSGKIDQKNTYLIYGGFVFLSKSSLESFNCCYQNYVNKIKTHYKEDKEIKSNILKYKDRKKFLEEFKKYYSFALVILNEKLYEDIKKDAKAKGRFIDYGLKRCIKTVLKDLIKKDAIKRNDSLELEILIDNQTIKSNGLYDLEKSIQKELTKGMKPILEASYSPLFKNIKVHVYYGDSKKSLAIQASDILAGSVRRKMISQEEITFLDVLLEIP